MDSDVKIESKDFPNICRACLINTDLKPIVETDLVKIFTSISEIQIHENDKLPGNFCITCLNYLQEIYKFAELCKANNDILKLVLESEGNKLNNLDINLEPYKCEYDNDYDDVKPESDDNDSSYCLPLKDEINDDSEDEKPFRRRTRKRKSIYAEPKSLRIYKRRGRKPKVESDDDDKSNSVIPVCKSCGTTFTSKTKLCSHYKEHEHCRPKNFKLYQCEVCQKEFSTARRRNEHMNIHTGEVPYICSYCGKGFQLYSAHFKHVYTHRLALGEVELKPGYTEKRVRLNLKCDLCPKVFASRSGFANHQLIHQGVKIQYRKRIKEKETGPKLKNFLCNYCAKSFRTKIQLDGHIRGHTGERPFNCSYCHKFFKTKAALKTHEMNHLGTTPQRFKCETCNKPFSLKAHYEVHCRTHTGEKPFECHFCGKCFNYRGTWRIHLRIHTGETPYGCPVCNNRYHDKSSLIKHQKKKGHLGEAIVEEKLLF
ncbi:zinc finger protein 84-like isoform X2 [Sitophilus oryzae]|uniref:Zinc finger protein 84-like isoform X2 n=1 Tax=Sitophilus oryzae TaxID=7048 RepID=A0A6J2XQF7_SITOR|nr:zinc finger protein 84-like isoform X2 [Sitophilus oryzae]